MWQCFKEPSGWVWIVCLLGACIVYAGSTHWLQGINTDTYCMCQASHSDSNSTFTEIVHVRCTYTFMTGRIHTCSSNYMHVYIYVCVPSVRSECALVHLLACTYMYINTVADCGEQVVTCMPLYTCCWGGFFVLSCVHCEDFIYFMPMTLL